MQPTWPKVACTCTAVVLVLVAGHFSRGVEAQAQVGHHDRCDATTEYQSSSSQAASQQAQQVKIQQILLSVLKNITAGSISASTALRILQDVAVLRDSLKDGAAAVRWAALKSKSAAAQQLQDPQQQQQPQQTQQEPDQQSGAAVPSGPFAGPAHQQQQKSRRRQPRASGGSWLGSNPPRPSRGSKEASSVGRLAHPKQQQHSATPASAEPVEARPAAPSRGLLIVAGNTHQFKNAFILLQLLRHATINCLLPAEVVHYGAAELDPAVAAAMQKHAAATNTSLTIIDGSTAVTGDLPPHRPLKAITGFKTKVHALAFVTSFDHVLLLDSDNTPLADPTYLLDSATFRRTGNLFWLDFW
jgi:hypothetical protein